MAPKIAFETAEDACKAIGQGMGYKKEKPSKDKILITARPYNQYEPSSSQWWLIPGTDWPAYHRGKLHFGIENDDPVQMFIAYYVEKGIGPSAREFFKPSWVMGKEPEWMWKKFLRDFKAGLVPEAIAKMARETEQNPEICIEAGVVTQTFDPEERFEEEEEEKDKKKGYYWLEWDPKKKHYGLIQAKPATAEPKLSDYSRIKDHGELAQLLAVDGDKDWLWINFFIGLTFDVVKPESKSKGVWNPEQIQETLFRPFYPWVE